MDVKEVVKNLVKNGAKEVKDVKVLTATVTPSESVEGLARIAFNTNKQFDFIQTDDNGTESKTKTNIVISSNYAIIGILRTNEFAAPVIGELQLKPKALEVILAGATIEVVQESVKKDTDYVNPFTTKKDAEATQFDHNTIINHIVSIKLSDRAEAQLSRISDKILGL